MDDYFRRATSNSADERNSFIENDINKTFYEGFGSFRSTKPEEENTYDDGYKTNNEMSISYTKLTDISKSLKIASKNLKQHKKLKSNFSK